MTKLIATIKQAYAKRDYNPGDPFEASDDDALLLIMIGAASRAPAQPVEAAPPQASAPVYATKDSVPQGDDTPSPSNDKKQSNTYKHRSLRAENPSKNH